jgi:hypothetical protein
MPQCVGTVPTYAMHTTLLPWQMKSIFIIVMLCSFLLEMPRFTRDSGCFMICCQNADCGKFEQILASYYHLLVVKLVVKRGWVTTKDFP